MEGAQRVMRHGPRRVAVLFVAGLAGCTMIGAHELERAEPAGTGTTDGAPSYGSGAVGSESRPVAGTPSYEPPSRGGNMVEYEQSGGRYRVLDSSRDYDERGLASWYGEYFHGRPTSSGEPFDMHELSAAHRTLPLPTWVLVTNLANGRSLRLRVNDRGPFHDPDERIIDVSYAAAVELGMVGTGTAPVRVEAIEPWQSRTR